MFTIPTPPRNKDNKIKYFQKSEGKLALGGKRSLVVPSDIALIKIMDARMKMMRDALPMTAINLLTTCCPTKAATVATPTRYRAAQTYMRDHKFVNPEQPYGTECT